MPNRIIKESIRASKSVNSMTDFQFRLWIHLITYVDDYGRGSADPEILKGFVFPRLKKLRESDIETALRNLERIGSIHIYTIDGEPYLCLPNWGSHQRIQTKMSKFPSPPTGTHGDSRCSTVTHGDSPPESNPIQSNPNPIQSESKYKSESNTPLPPKSGGMAAAVDSLFDEFWKNYPRKESPKTAKAVFLKLKPDKNLLTAMLEWIEKAKLSPQWQDKTKIPHPTTWLNQERWKGDPPPMATGAPIRAPAPKNDTLAYLDAQIAAAKAEVEAESAHG